ncbi:MAG TPA: hypothetical protein VNO86_01445 [Candidatus Binatia bacterium]|nr:hypothetical protein [Candidatus Binatia bacterium]
MRELVNEILLRLGKAAAAAALGVLVFVGSVVLGGASPSPELALLSWLSGVAFVLVVQESPI